ncbi:uncharacterized protein BKA55DRAFT_262071 [Fusarium redolens]|uniref:Uncharacterized protein n=1 Tax=Fusarium redolens TaxID=48865 RepID=A0A9P9FUX9_FUSRE|nr:uncharacterized protein BKA55DRAFT_262071 [Fusarium redolens]KAH7208431.1 hypothetical protein BKA55DRAFT_262071 [Fusarium redolens]
MLKPVAHGLSRKRSHSDALGYEKLRPHCDLLTAHPSDSISNDVCRILDIRVKKNKPEGMLDNAFSNDNIAHGDLATNHSTEGNSLIDEGLRNEGLTDEGIGDDESTCSTKTIKSGDIQLKTLWDREYPINEW